MGVRCRAGEGRCGGVGRGGEREGSGEDDSGVRNKIATTDDQDRSALESRGNVWAIVVGAMTASETRPRCEAIGDGAFLNLRGRTAPTQLARPVGLARLGSEGPRGRSSGSRRCKTLREGEGAVRVVAGVLAHAGGGVDGVAVEAEKGSARPRPSPKRGAWALLGAAFLAGGAAGARPACVGVRYVGGAVGWGRDGRCWGGRERRELRCR